MPKSDRSAWILVGALCACSLLLNVVTINKLRFSSPSRFCISGSEDDSKYSYVGDDRPVELPLELKTVALAVEDSNRYGVSNPQAWAEWTSLDYFKPGPNHSAFHGFVRLGPTRTLFGVSMFHQLHCLGMIRMAIISFGGEGAEHIHHCLNLLRQMILCAADTTLDPMSSPNGTDGLSTHICRDWTQLFDYVHKNQAGWEIDYEPS